MILTIDPQFCKWGNVPLQCITGSKGKVFGICASGFLYDEGCGAYCDFWF